MGIGAVFDATIFKITYFKTGIDAGTQKAKKGVKVGQVVKIFMTTRGALGNAA